MQRILIPWSQVRIPGVSAVVVKGELQTSDPIIEVPHSTVDELMAAFSAFCGSWQQGDRHACAILTPLLTKHGVAPLPL